MVIVNVNDLDRGHCLKVDAAVVLSWNWLLRWPEDQAKRVDQIDGEVILQISGELVPAQRLLDRDQAQVVSACQHSHSDHDRPRHTGAVPTNKVSPIVEHSLKLAVVKPYIQQAYPTGASLVPENFIT